jgi:hypothetical protein
MADKKYVDECVYTLHSPIKIQLSEVKFTILPDDVIQTSFEEGYHDNDCWTPDFHYFEVYRKRLETDEEFNDRIEDNKKQNLALRNNRYKNYLKFKEEFENSLFTEQFLIDNGWELYDNHGNWVKTEWKTESERLGLPEHLCPNWYRNENFLDACKITVDELSEKLKDNIPEKAMSWKYVFNSKLSVSTDPKCREDIIPIVKNSGYKYYTWGNKVFNIDGIEMSFKVENLF